jgi:hypothetical protein
MSSAKVIGALLPAERAVIDERDRLVRRFWKEDDPTERTRLMRQIESLVKRYDDMRRGRLERGELQ